MDIQQAKAAFLHEAAREKRIVLRNTIVLAVIAIIVLALVLVYAREALFNSVSEMGTSKKQGLGRYLPILVVLGVVGYGYFSVSSTLKRTKAVEDAFALIEKGEKVAFYNESKSYLTHVYLFIINYKLDPIYYLSITVKGKVYTLSIDEILLPDVKRVLEYGDVQEYNNVMSSIYTNGSNDQTAAATVEQGGLGQSSVDIDDEIVLKPLEEFRADFQQKYGDEIKEMEDSRKETSKKTRMLAIIGIIASLTMVGCIMMFGQDISDKYGSTVFIIGFMILSCGFAFFYSRRAKKKAMENPVGVDFTSFKGTMYDRMAKYIHPKYQYFEHAHVGLAELFHAGLFKENMYTITGGDQFVGQYKGVPFQLCDLGLTFRPNFRKEKEPDDTVFSGKYFVAKFPKTFQANILIVPKKGIMGSFSDNDISDYINKSNQKVVLEDPEFQKMFTVYCDDQVASRYVLTPAFMEKVKELSLRNKGNMYFAINGNNIVIATNSGSTIGDEYVNILTALSGTKLDQSLLDEMYTMMLDQLYIIDTLKLSREI